MSELKGSDAPVRVAVLFIFGVLSAFYWASLARRVDAFGGAFAEGALTASVAARVVGGVLSLLIVAFTIVGTSVVRIGSALAWTLLVLVLVVLFMDTLRGNVQGLVSAFVIFPHLLGAVFAQRLARHAAF